MSLATCCCARPRCRHRHRLGLMLPMHGARRGLPPAPALRAAHPVRHRRSSSRQQRASGALSHALRRPAAHRNTLLASAGPAAPLGLASEDHPPHICPCALTRLPRSLMPRPTPVAGRASAARRGLGGGGEQRGGRCASHRHAAAAARRLRSAAGAERSRRGAPRDGHKPLAGLATQ